MGGKFQATFHDPKACKRGCCWTPQGVCARGYRCTHHVAAERAQERREVQAAIVQDLERSASRAVQGKRVR